MGVDLIHEQLFPMGFGRKTGIDVEGEVTGDLPSTDWKKRRFKKPEQQKWYAGETISLGIGQGYNAFTMLQLASATATLPDTMRLGTSTSTRTRAPGVRHGSARHSIRIAADPPSSPWSAIARATA